MKLPNNVKNIKFKEYEIFKEHGRLYLRVVYTYEADDGIHEVYLPQIATCIREDQLPMFICQPYMFRDDDVRMRCETIEYMLDKDTFKVPNKFGGVTEVTAHVADVLVKKNQVEMTIEEIEKKLGHKIKIVGEKG